jgi:hypothetical protein
MSFLVVWREVLVQVVWLLLCLWMNLGWPQAPVMQLLWVLLLEVDQDAFQASQ